MSCKYCVAGAVGDAIGVVYCKVIKELEYVSVCVVGGWGLLLGELNEGYQEFVVDGLGIIADGSKELLDKEFSGAVKRQASRSFRVVLNLFSIDDRGVMVRGVLRFLGVGVIEIGAQVCYVVVNHEAAGTLDIVPSEVNSSI